MKLFPVVTLLSLINIPLPAQSSTPVLHFEVASVKPAKSGNNGYSGGCRGIDSKYAGANERASAPPLGRCVIKDARLSHMLGIAFRLTSLGYIKGGPDWVMTGERYSVDAQADEPTKATEEQLLQMLQALLIERFSLKFHREAKDMPATHWLSRRTDRSCRRPKERMSDSRLARGESQSLGSPRA